MFPDNKNTGQHFSGGVHVKTWAHHAIAAAWRAVVVTGLGATATHATSKVALLGLAAHALHQNQSSIMKVLVE